MGIRKIDSISIEDYLREEEVSELKHEYEGGVILAMSGGTINHGMICGNIYNELRKALEGVDAECTAIGSEVRIHIKAADSIVYSDAMVVCGDIAVSEADEEAVVNPLLVVEVLSKSTSGYDRGDKFFKYRQLSSLKEYILIDQEKAVIESFFKKENNIWEISRVIGLESYIDVKCINIQLRLEFIYQNVRWSE